MTTTISNWPQPLDEAPKQPQSSIDILNKTYEEQIKDIEQIQPLRDKVYTRGGTPEEIKKLAALEDAYKARGVEIEKLRSEAKMRAEQAKQKVETAVAPLTEPFDNSKAAGGNPDKKAELDTVDKNYKAQAEDAMNDLDNKVSQAAQQVEVAKGEVIATAQAQETKLWVDSALNNGNSLNFESYQDRQKVAILLGLPGDFFNATGSFDDISNFASLQSLLITVNHIVQNNLDVPRNSIWDLKKFLLQHGYKKDGIIFQEAEAKKVLKVIDHIQNNSQYKTILKYIIANKIDKQNLNATANDLYTPTLRQAAKLDVQGMSQSGDGTLEVKSNDPVAVLVWERMEYSNMRTESVQAAVTTAMKKWFTMAQIFENVTGESIVSKDAAAIRIAFHDALSAQVALFQGLGINAWADSIIQGKQQEFLKQVRTKIENGEQFKLKEINTGPNVPDFLVNVASAILGVAVSFGTAGKVILNLENRQTIKTNSIVQEIEKAKNDPTLGDSAKTALWFFGEILTARKKLLSVGHAEFLNALKTRILEQATQVLDIKFDTNPASIKNENIRNAFQRAKETGFIRSEADMKQFHKTIIEHIIDQEALGVKDQKHVWASTNILFTGLHYDRVETQKFDNQLDNSNALEAKVTSNEVNRNTFKGVEISEDNKKFVIPSTIESHDGAILGKIPVFLKGSDGNLTPITESLQQNFDKPQKLHMDRIINAGRAMYIASFTELPIQEQKQPEQAQVAVTDVKDNTPEMTAKVTNILKTRQEVMNESKNLGDSIYIMTRDKKYINFNKAMDQIGNQDYQTAIATLKNWKSRTEKELYRQFKDRPEDLAVALTFKYGGKWKNKLGEFSQQEYQKERTQGVKNAENRLTTYNKNTPEIEQFFEKNKHTPTEVSDLIPGQNLAVSVFATPRGGTHRIDNFSGSIKVSNHTLEIKNADAKGEIFDRHKKTNEKVLSEMNAYLKGNNKPEITSAEFKDWIVSGAIPAKIANDVEVTKNPKFLEARAMVQWNLCVNKTEVIGYPLLKIKNAPPPPPVVTPKPEQVPIDTGSSTTTQTQEEIIKRSDLGVTPAVFINKPKPQTPPTDTPPTTTPNEKEIIQQSVTNIQADKQKFFWTNIEPTTGNNIYNVTPTTPSAGEQIILQEP